MCMHDVMLSYLQLDPTVDMIRASLVPVLRRFVGGEEGPSVKCVRRGMSPGGGGRVVFTCPVRRSLTAFQVTRAEKQRKKAHYDHNIHKFFLSLSLSLSHKHNRKISINQALYN